jgi:hypothetical protein
MSFWRIAAGLVTLFCFLTSMAAGADLTYSGVPGKWKKGAKGAKTAAAESESTPDAKKKNNEVTVKPVLKKK